MFIFLLSALGLFLLQFRNYTRGSRVAALKVLEPSSRLRPILENYWLLSNLAAAATFTGFWVALYFHGAGDRPAAIFCWIAAGLGAAISATLSGLPDYIVVSAQNRRRAKRRSQGR